MGCSWYIELELGPNLPDIFVSRENLHARLDARFTLKDTCVLLNHANWFPEKIYE